MTNEYQLSYTSLEVDAALQMARNSILKTEMNLSKNEQTVARNNIAAVSIDEAKGDLVLTATPETFDDVLAKAYKDTTIQLTPSDKLYHINLTKYRCWKIHPDGTIGNIPSGVKYRTTLHTPCYVASPVKFNMMAPIGVCGAEMNVVTNVGDKLYLQEGVTVEKYGNSVKLLQDARAYSYLNPVYIDLKEGTILNLLDNPIRAVMAYKFASTHPDYKENEVVFLDVDDLPQTNIECVINPVASIKNQVDDSTLVIEEFVSFPENLTIKGCEGAKVADVRLSCGLSNEWYFFKPNMHQSALPKGLTFDSLDLTGNFTLRNCSIEDLSIVNCHFGHGAAIEIRPSVFEVLGTIRYHQCAKVTNLLIKNNTLNFASAPNKDKNKTRTAIFVECADGITICDNTILNPEFNGIQVGGIDVSGGDPKTWYRYSTSGKVNIDNNVIDHSGSRAIRLAWMKDATVVIVGNYLKYANTVPEEASDNGKELIKVNKYSADNCEVYVGNTYYQGSGYANEPYWVQVGAEEIIVQPTA